ncbi:MAG TPA: phosphoribosyltransferase family protein [Candidatus Saccharimonadia bacterium]
MLQQLARFLAPPCCLSCDVEGSLVCPSCWEKVFQPAEIGCNGLANVIAAGPYASVMRELVARLKYKHQREAAAVFARALLPRLEPKRFEYNSVTAVPVVTARLRQRGYNQAELIAKELARSLALPYRRLLVRRRVTQQVGKSRAERLEHVGGAFVAKPNVGGLRVLLIDDVLTTGATLAECAGVLHRAGANEITGAVAAWD